MRCVRPRFHFLKVENQRQSTCYFTQAGQVTRFLPGPLCGAVPAAPASLPASLPAAGPVQVWSALIDHGERVSSRTPPSAALAVSCDIPATPARHCAAQDARIARARTPAGRGFGQRASSMRRRVRVRFDRTRRSARSVCQARVPRLPAPPVTRQRLVPAKCKHRRRCSCCRVLLLDDIGHLLVGIIVDAEAQQWVRYGGNALPAEHIGPPGEVASAGQ